MRPSRAALAIVVLLACSLGGVASSATPAAVGPSQSLATPPTGGTSNATLVEALPNPVADGDPGEFVAVRFPAPTNTTGWSVTDGKTTARLPNRTVEGTVALAVAPAAARQHTDYRVSELDGRLRLADGGDRLELRRYGATVDAARYRNAPEARVRDFGVGAWRPVGATDVDPVRTAGGEATAFVLPDAGRLTSETLRDAEERLLVAGYTLTSERLTAALLAAVEDGADVRVLLDGSPVGGVDERQARLLDRLTAGGVDVRLPDGPHARYRHHHSKYAVVDDRALVLTENFKPAGTGGMSSRGWGVILRDPAAADALAELHTADWQWRAATTWSNYREGRSFADADPAMGDFDTRHPPAAVSVDAATVLVAPDNAEDGLVAELDDAEERILVQQVEIGSRDDPFLRALLRAADRGVTVRVQLSDAWYVEETNAAIVDWLNRQADATGWDLEARVDESTGYQKIHTKGVVADDTVVLGSLNWANSAAEENRETLLALEGSAAAAYYADVFASDWSYDRGRDRSLPAGVLGGVAVAVCGALLVARRIEVVGRDGMIADWQW